MLFRSVYVEPREVNGRPLDQKIASIGVAIKRHVAFHGVGLNICTDLRHFDLILPCGLQDTQMTSLQREYGLRGLGDAPGMAEAKRAVQGAFVHTFDTYDWTLPQLAALGAPA